MPKKDKEAMRAVFGQLTHVAGDLWHRPIELTIFGKVCAGYLMVDISPTNGIEKNQLIAYSAFSKRTDGLIKNAEKAIFDYYRSICGEYRDRRGIVDPDDRSTPVIAELQDLSKLLTLEGATFPYVRSQPTFGLLFKCTWEKEHGMAVKFENGRVVEVGFQDIVL